MARIKAFNGLRFTKKAGDIEKLVCPPYDIISEKQRQEFLDANENNIIRLELPKGEDPYKEAGKTLASWLEDGILKTDDKPGVYVYEMQFVSGGKNYAVKGVICLVGLEDFSKGIILPHEETLSKAKEDRFNLMNATFCNFSQIYSLYMDEDNSTYSIIDRVSSGAPDVSVTDGDGVRHNLWCVYDEKEILLLVNKFADKKLYIADGHHRYETALRFSKTVREVGLVTDEDAKSDYVCMMLVNMENDGLVVLPTHRIVRDLESFDSGELISKCGQYFDVEKACCARSAEEKITDLYNQNKKAFAMYDGKDYYVLTLKDLSVMDSVFENASEAYKGLDVNVLHSLVLERLLGIDKENMAKQINLTYTKIADEAIEAVDSKKANCAFLLNPTRVSEIRDVAAAGEKMPQKSTYFYPKLITGLVMNKLD